MSFNERRVAERRRSGERPTVVLLDDETLIRAALRRALSEAGIEVIGEADNAPEAVTLITDLRPDVVVMEIRLGGRDRVQAVEEISRLAPASRVLVLTRAEQHLVVEAIVAGASGYVLKSASVEAMVQAVRATAAGEAILSSPIAGVLLQHIREREIPISASGRAAGDTIRAVLTQRELEIFSRLASGASNQHIGQELCLSANTVRNHIASILEKLHLDNRIQAAAHAVRAGIS